MDWLMPEDAIEHDGITYSLFDEEYVWVLDDNKGWILDTIPDDLAVVKGKLVLKVKVKNTCVCDIDHLMRSGCKCGALQKG